MAAHRADRDGGRTNEGDRVIRYECDKCGVALQANDPNRFIVKMEVYAAAGPIELDPDSLTDTKSGMKAVLDQLRQADPDEVEDQTYRVFRFDVCDACRRTLMQRPLG